MSVFAHRWWTYNDWTGRLGSLVRVHGDWKPGWNKATHENGYGDEALWGDGTRYHNAPQRACDCGFYGAKPFIYAEKLKIKNESPQIHGIIEMAGTIQEHQDGWRSSMARVVTLIRMPVPDGKRSITWDFSNPNQLLESPPAYAYDHMNVERTMARRYGVPLWEEEEFERLKHRLLTATRVPPPANLVVPTQDYAGQQRYLDGFFREPQDTADSQDQGLFERKYTISTDVWGQITSAAVKIIDDKDLL